MSGRILSSNAGLMMAHSTMAPVMASRTAGMMRRTRRSQNCESEMRPVRSYSATRSPLIR